MALFKPNPDAESVEEIIEALSREIADRYREAENELIREIAVRARRDLELQGLVPTAPAGHGLTVAERRRQNRILAELAAHRAVALRELQTLAMQAVERLKGDLARRVIEIAATEGEAAAAAQLGLAARQGAVAIPFPVMGGPVATSASTFTGTAAQAAAMVSLSLESRLEVLNQRITRYPQDAFQRVVSLHSPNTLLGITTSRVQQAATVQRFLAEGIPAFFDRSGRRWTIGAYAEMAGRTSVNRAYTDAGVWRMGQAGVHLVTVVRGLDSCRKCADWSGKILSTDGTVGPVTLPHATEKRTVTVEVAATVDQARAAGWGHPNCRCRLVPYLPGLTVPQDDTTYDPDAEAERATQRRLEREIRAAKRREATAMNDTDAARARAEIRESQASMREFINRTGRNRSSYREQLHFADGRGGGARAGFAGLPPTTPKRPPTVQYRVAKDTRLGEGARHSVSQMRKVHSIPQGTHPVTIERLHTKSTSKLGSYSRADATLRLNPVNPELEFTVVHELGHWLDNKVFGDDLRYGSQALGSQAWKDWRAAVDATTPTNYLQRVLGVISSDPGQAALATHVRYMLDPKEQFARSYAQWIATRTDDAILRSNLLMFQGAQNYTLRAYQWDDAEFEPIGAALDRIFKEAGMLK